MIKDFTNYDDDNLPKASDKANQIDDSMEVNPSSIKKKKKSTSKKKKNPTKPHTFKPFWTDSKKQILESISGKICPANESYFAKLKDVHLNVPKDESKCKKQWFTSQIQVPKENIRNKKSCRKVPIEEEQYPRCKQEKEEEWYR